MMIEGQCPSRDSTSTPDINQMSSLDHLHSSAAQRQIAHFLWESRILLRRFATLTHISGDRSLCRVIFTA
jgi:hypothetical protein